MTDYREGLKAAASAPIERRDGDANWSLAGALTVVVIALAALAAFWIYPTPGESWSAILLCGAALIAAGWLCYRRSIRWGDGSG